MLLAVAALVWFLSLVTRRKRRLKRLKFLRNARFQEKMFGEHFLNMALEKQKDIRCWVIYKHYPWGHGYKVRLEDLCEPDDILSVVVNFSFPEKKRIAMGLYSDYRYFSTSRNSLDRATEEFERRLMHLVYETQRVP